MPPKKNKPKGSARPPVPSLEEAIEELTGIVQELETGRQPLESALEKFDRGIQLMKYCDGQLQAAAGRIEQLQAMSADGNEEVASFDATATAGRSGPGPSDEDQSDDVSGSLF